MSSRRAFLQTRIYLRIHRDRVVARNLDSGASIQEVPSAPYEHPRMLIGDFDAAGMTIGRALEQARDKNPLKRLQLLIHPAQGVNDAPTSSEKVLYRMLGYDAGATKVILWFGHALSDEEALEQLQGQPN